MNKYIIAVTIYCLDRNGSKVERKYLFGPNKSLTETVECAMVGKKVTMRSLMKSIKHAHRVADRKYAAENALHHIIFHYRVKLVRYEKAYERETVQGVLES